ncbi:MAG: T9SS type A sorting domain-containing protein [Bacteroidales bacterium]|nr:T9SS type A sorting domain-containing protein [Bacteroidales bacterium]
MDKKLNFKQLAILFAMILATCCGSVYAQNSTPAPDSVYHPMFGCDSVQLTIQNNTTTYFSDTVIMVEGSAVGPDDQIYVNRRDFYQITVGQSYDVVDTVTQSVCRNNLPFAFRNNFYTQSGEYWTSATTVSGCDSSRTLLVLQVLEGQHETIQLTMCYDDPVVVYDNITFNQPGTFNRILGYDEDGCPIQQTFVVTQYPLVYDTVNAAICQSQSYTCHGTSFDSTGVYTVPYTTETGCQGITILNLTVNPATFTQQTQYVTVCAVDLPYVSNGRSFDAAGNYMMNLKNQYGCDSVLVTLVLSVTMPLVDTTTITLCPSEFPYTFDSAHVYTAPGQYFIDLAADTACWHYRYLVLNQYPTVNDTTYMYTADSSYTFHDSVFTESTVYTFVDTTVNGCLDYHTLNLTMNHQLVYDTVTASVCANLLPYVLNGISYNESGSYNQTLQNIHGFDSAAVTLNLTVNQNVAVTNQVTITRNDIPYFYHGNTYSESGVYVLQIPAATANECDTFYTLNLTVEPVYYQTVDTTVCANQPVLFLGDVVTTLGAHQYTFHFADYDSVVTLNVNHNPVYRDATTAVVVGEYELPYNFNGTLCNTAGYYEQTLTSVLGCDSVISIMLTVNPAVINSDTIYQEVCSNDLPVTLYDSALTQAGTYRFIVRTVSNLYDSVFYVNLTVKESPALILADTAYLCVGGSATLTAQSTGSNYLWNNGSTQSSISVTMAGTYSVTVSNAFECTAADTVQVIQVDLPVAQITGSGNVCVGSLMGLKASGGVSYLWSTGAVTDSITVKPNENTTYYVTVTNVYGCSASQSQLVTVHEPPVLNIMGNNSICENETSTFIATGAYTYLWNTGVHADRITVGTEGFYSVTGTDTYGCQSTATVSLVVHPIPLAKINGRTTICQGGSTLLTAAGATSYEWSSGEVTPAITVSFPGAYTVTASDQYGCSAVSSVSVTQSFVNASISGNLYFCHGQSTTLNVTGDVGNTYRWDDGSTTSSITVSSAGQYSVLVTNANGCQNTLSKIVNEYNVTPPTILGAATICENQTTTLRASGGVSYVWDDGSTQPMITVGATGTYTVTSTNTYGCTASNSFTVLVNPVPTVNVLSQNSICRGESVSLAVITSANTYNWSTGDNTATITVSPTSSTNYTVLVTDENGCTNTATKQITVNQLPQLFINGPSTICQGDTGTLVASGGVAYQWSTGQYTSTLDVTASGIYTVTATGENNCTVSASKQVTMYALPIATLTESADICRGQQATLSVDAPAGCNYEWSTGSHQSHISVGVAGTYYVTVTNSNQCSRVYQSTVIVHELPQISIIGNSEVCQGQSTALTVTGDAVTQYAWSNGDHNPTITVNTAGQYSVTATNSYGCSSTASRGVVVHPLPEPQITGQTTICRGSSTTLTASGGIAYVWNTSNTGSNITVSPLSNQSYAVTVSNAFGCMSSASTTVTVNSLPEISFSGNTTTCAGISTSVAALGASSYQWSNGATGNTLSTSNQGVYYVTATSAQGCVSVDSVAIVVNPNPVLQITGNDYVCAGSYATLTVTGAESYQWSNLSTGASISVSPANTTTYTVTGTDSQGCQSTASKVLAVEALPQISITGTKTICAGQSTTLTATGGSSYLWSTGDAISNVVVSPASTQSYVVTVTNTYGCLASSAVTVTVNALPNISFAGNTTICQGNTTTITAMGASTYSWSTGAQTSNIIVGTTGLYTVTATNAQGCSNSDSIFVKLNPNPQVQIIGDNHLCSGSVATLTATGANSYYWSTGETSSEISISPSSSTDYYVIGTDSNACSTTIHKMVSVEELPNVQILGSRTICQGQSTVLTAMGGSTYAWSTGSTSQDIAVFPNFTTNYTVTAYNSFGCSATGTATVTVNMLPSVIFNGNTSFCEGESSVITVTGGSNFVWSTGATTSAITVSTPGTYKVSVTNSLNCMRSDSVNVVVWDNPVVNISGLGLICEGASTDLTASGAQTYSWNTGEANAVITVMPAETTLYSVVGTDANGCSSTVSHVVNVESLPEAQISGLLSICHGDTTTLTASSAAEYLWNTGATTQQIQASDYGIYTVTVTSVTGCQSAASVTVVDNPVPVFELHGVGSICENTTAELSVEGDNSYLWSTGSTDTMITISEGGFYTVTATNSYGCSESSSILVMQLNAPILTIVGVDELCQGDSTILMAVTDAHEYLWSTGDTTQTVQVIPDNTTYDVTVTGDNGCSTTAEHTIVTLPTYNMTVTGEICEHDSYSQYGFDIPVMDTAGVYTFTHELQTVAGCDSIVHLMLTVNPMPRLDTINGPQNITQYGNAYFSINNPEYVNNFEWQVTNPHWTLTNANLSNVTLNVNNTNGTGTLFVRGFNNCGYTQISLDITCNVGIEDHPTQASVKLYPNPVHQSLYIDLDNASDVAKVALYNEAGRLVYQTDCNDTHIEIDCTRFANGHYTVQFLNEKGRRVESRKIIVNNK